jgi:anti-sigma regulatory factor (Ser/Thr protein kinase)
MGDIGVRVQCSYGAGSTEAQAGMTTAWRSSEHLAFLYRDAAEYLAHVRAFALTDGADSEPLFVAVAGQAQGPLRQLLRGRRGPVAFHDMADLGRNPARIIPAALSFARTYPHRTVLCLWQPAWPERSDAELCEVARHEAAANLALGGTGIRVLCAYDVSALRPSVIAQARCTHPLILDDDHRMVNAGYLGPAVIPPGCRRPLAAPPPDAESLTYQTDLRPVRALAAAEASRAGLPAGRSSDLVLAVSELAANTLRHACGAGTLHAWHTSREMLCQIHDDGFIADPLAGYRRERPGTAGRHGLWLVNQLCDLAELRSGPHGTGTTTRLHIRRPAGQRS